MTMYLVLSALTPSPISLVAATKVSAFFCSEYVCFLPAQEKWKCHQETTHSQWLFQCKRGRISDDYCECSGHTSTGCMQQNVKTHKSDRGLTKYHFGDWRQVRSQIFNMPANSKGWLQNMAECHKGLTKYHFGDWRQVRSQIFNMPANSMGWLQKHGRLP
jgi:hypothetical protein